MMENKTQTNYLESLDGGILGMIRNNLQSKEDLLPLRATSRLGKDLVDSHIDQQDGHKFWIKGLFATTPEGISRDQHIFNTTKRSMIDNTDQSLDVLRYAIALQPRILYYVDNQDRRNGLLHTAAENNLVDCTKEIVNATNTLSFVNTMDQKPIDLTDNPQVREMLAQENLRPLIQGNGQSIPGLPPQAPTHPTHAGRGRGIMPLVNPQAMAGGRGGGRGILAAQAQALFGNNAGFAVPPNVGRGRGA